MGAADFVLTLTHVRVLFVLDLLAATQHPGDADGRDFQTIDSAQSVKYAVHNAFVLPTASAEIGTATADKDVAGCAEFVVDEMVPRVFCLLQYDPEIGERFFPADGNSLVKTPDHQVNAVLGAADLANERNGAAGIKAPDVFQRRDLQAEGVMVQKELVFFRDKEGVAVFADGKEEVVKPITPFFVGCHLLHTGLLSVFNTVIQFDFRL